MKAQNGGKRLTQEFHLSHVSYGMPLLRFRPVNLHWTQLGLWGRGVPAVITQSHSMCYEHNNKEKKCKCSQPRDKKKSLALSLFWNWLSPFFWNFSTQSVLFCKLTGCYVVVSVSTLCWIRLKWCASATEGFWLPELQWCRYTMQRSQWKCTQRLQWILSVRLLWQIGHGPKTDLAQLRGKWSGKGCIEFK